MVFLMYSTCLRYRTETVAGGRDGGAGGSPEQVREGAPHQDASRGESQVRQSSFVSVHFY